MCMKWEVEEIKWEVEEIVNLQQMTIVMRPSCWHKLLALIGCLAMPKGYV